SVGENDALITLLYSILQGAAAALGIPRDDINGGMDYSEEQPVLILFDETPGGAGHVKRIYHKLDEVLRSAWLRVDGHCNCGAETACYGCLRSYSNQLDHDRLARGLARQYLEWLLLSSVNKAATLPAAPSDITEKNPTETTISIPAP